MRETWIKWAIEREMILRLSICEGNMDKVGHSMGTILKRTICEENMDKVDKFKEKRF